MKENSAMNKMFKTQGWLSTLKKYYRIFLKITYSYMQLFFVFLFFFPKKETWMYMFLTRETRHTHACPHKTEWQTSWIQGPGSRMPECKYTVNLAVARRIG